MIIGVPNSCTDRNVIQFSYPHLKEKKESKEKKRPFIEWEVLILKERETRCTEGPQIKSHSVLGKRFSIRDRWVGSGSGLHCLETLGKTEC